LAILTINTRTHDFTQPKELKDTKEANKKEQTDKDKPTTGKSKTICGTKKL
jgi:hypothetical protein